MTQELTPRQQREREYYDQFAQRSPVTEVSFGPVVTDERRPWNSYWDTYRFLADLHAAGATRLLDVGCGEGMASMRYAKVGYEVSGFDISEQNVLKCRELAERHGFSERTDFSAQTAENLTYPDASFDVVAGIDILHHIDIPNAILETRRVLKPGGTAVYREWLEAPVLDSVRKSPLMQRLFPRTMSFDGHITWDEHPLTKEELASILETFPNHEIRHYGLLSRFRKVAPPKRGDIPDQLEMLDRRLFGALPPLRHLGGEVVLILHA